MKLTPLVTGLSLAASLALAEPVDLGEIQVESSTIADLESTLKTEPSTISVIDEKTYEIISPKTINDVLRTVPGITADVRSGDTVEIHMRGVAQQEFMWEDTGVAIVIDGVPVLQNGGKVKINLDNIESIKVIKGGASYLYGPNALAGAVIITTKKPKGSNNYSVSFETGSYGYKNGVATFNRSTDKYLANLNLSARYEDGFWYKSENWTGSANGKFTYFIDDSSDITAGVELTRKYEQNGGRSSITGLENALLDPTGEASYSIPWRAEYWSSIQKYFLTYNKDFSDGGNLMTNAYYYLDKYDYISSPQDLNGDGIRETYTRDTSEDISQYGFKSEYRNSIGKLAYMFGIDLGHREREDTYLTTVDYSSRRGSGYAGDTSTGDSIEDRLGLYAETKYEVTPEWTVIGNVRYDYENYEYEVSEKTYDGSNWTTSDNKWEKSFSNISYRVGTTYQYNENATLFSNISTGFRNPRLRELYAGDLDPDRYTNNPDLDTETTINYEIGLRGTFSLFNTDIKYEASVYQIDTKDIIAREFGTYYSDPNRRNPVITKYDNVGDARTRGAELSLHSDRSKKLAFSVAYTYMDAYYTKHLPFKVNTGDEYDVTGNQLPRTPKHRLDLMTYYRLTDNWTLIAENYMQSDYYADETNLYKMPGYGIMNLQLRYENEIKGNKFEFFIKVDNIFDKHYVRTAYLFSDRDDDGDLDGDDLSVTMDPGRVVYAGFKYKF